MDINGNEINDSEEEYDGPDPISPHPDDNRDRSPIPEQHFPNVEFSDANEQFNGENGFITEEQPLVDEGYGDDDMFDPRLDPVQLIGKITGESVFRVNALPKEYESEADQSHLASNYPRFGAFGAPQEPQPESIASEDCFDDEDEPSEQLQTAESQEEPAKLDEDENLENNDRAEQGDQVRPAEDAKVEGSGDFEKIGDSVSELGGMSQEVILSDAQPKRTASEDMLIDVVVPNAGPHDLRSNEEADETNQQQQSLECPDRLPSELISSAGDVDPDGVTDRPATGNGKRRRKNPFIVFYLSMYSRRPKKRVADVARLAGRQWRRMTDKQRSKYVAMVAGSKPASVAADKAKDASEKRVGRRARQDKRSA